LSGKVHGFTGSSSWDRYGSTLRQLAQDFLVRVCKRALNLVDEPFSILPAESAAKPRTGDVFDLIKGVSAPQLEYVTKSGGRHVNPPDKVC
jgi:hypothetical protein